MLIIEITDRGAAASVLELVKRAQDYTPVLKEIGEDMAESTRRRFATSTAPDGTSWAPNSALTMARYSETFGTSLRLKDGSLNKKGQAKLAGKKPLIGQSKSLSTTINYQVPTSNSVSIGSPMVYAAMQHYGGTVEKFPHLWADIPARPIVGASADDLVNIADLVRSYLTGA